MLDDIFNHFVLVSFSPGHMGTFLKYFLSPISNKGSEIFLNTLEKNAKFENHEWQYSDVFAEFFAEDVATYKDLITLLSKSHSPPEVFKLAALTILNTKYYIIKNNLGYDPRTHMDLLLDFAKKPLDPNIQIPFDILKNISHRYVKGHPFKRYPGILETLSSVKWGNKIIRCEFPDEKSWIAFYLLKYKYSNSPNQTNKVNLPKIIDDLLLFPNISFVKRFSYAKYVKDIYDKNEYYNFNIYDLVINKNLKQVYEIDPSFEFNEEKKKILDTAHFSTLEILNFFGLDHNVNISLNTPVSDVIGMEKLNTKL